MRTFYAFGMIQVGDGPGDFENAVVGAGGKCKFLHGVLELLAKRCVEGAVFTDVGLLHAAVATLGGMVVEAPELDRTCCGATGADWGRGFARLGGTQLFDAESGCLNVNIDAVDEGAADAGAVALDLGEGATAGVDGVSGITTGAGVHGADEHEGGGESNFGGASGNRDLTVFEGLTQNFKGVAAEFGEFIEEEDALMCEGDFSGSWKGSTAKETDVTDGVMGGAEGPLITRAGGVKRDSCRGLNAENFEEFVEFGRGHDAGYALGDHGFTGAGASDHDKIVSPANCDFDSAAEVMLSFYVGKISLVGVGVFWLEGAEICGEGINLDFAV